MKEVDTSINRMEKGNRMMSLDKNVPSSCRQAMKGCRHSEGKWGFQGGFPSDKMPMSYRGVSCSYISPRFVLALTRAIKIALTLPS